jgi:hypothetical protein
MGTTYSYRPLQSPKSIRLINLKPSRKGALVCTLIEASLDKAPPYEALSYSWDGQSRDQYISCDGKNLAVTANCKAALNRLCRPFKSRLLWVDAICINQSLIEEKNQQVDIMFFIYAGARRTLIWLGESDINSDYAFKFLSRSAFIKSIPIESCQNLLIKALRVRASGNSPASNLTFSIKS